MGLFRENRIDQAHVRILESTYLCLAYLTSATKAINSPQALKAGTMCSEALNCLVTSYGGKAIRYQDYEPMISAARKIGSMVWNPGKEGANNVVAAITSSLDETGWRLDNEPEQFVNRTIEVPDVVKRLQAEQMKLGDIKESELSPYARLTREADLRSIGEAMNANENLLHLNGKMVDPKLKKLARLNVEFISEPVLNAWMHGLKAKNLLPKSPDPIYAALDDVEKHFHASSVTKEKLADQWLADCPHMGGDLVFANVSALLSSACSTKLDSFHHSSADVVRDIVSSIYREMEAQQKPKVTEEDQKLLKELQNAIEAVHAQFHRLEGRLPNGITRVAMEEAKVVTERLEAKTQSLLENLSADTRQRFDPPAL